MPTPSAFIAPLANTGSQGLLRAAIQERLAYYLAPNEDPQDFVATDPDLGSVTPVLLWNGGLFFLDPADTTTAHDGIAVLVSNDGLRYKREDEPTFRSVISMAETAPPGSPSIGDRYIPAAGATGDWATHDDEFAIFTARGWEFFLPPVGHSILNEDDEIFYHWTVAGAWEAGFGATPIAANSVIPASILGGKVAWIVENQTTNTPPVSPTTGDQYIIGGAPTGAWSGHAAKLAIFNGVDWTIVTPTEGYQAWNKALDVRVFYNGSAWTQIAQGWTLLNVQDASASATIDFAGFFSSLYTVYKVFGSNIVPSVDGAELGLRVGTGAGPTYQTTNYDNSDTATDGTYGLVIRGVGNAANEKCDLELTFSDPTASDTKLFKSQGTRINTAAAIFDERNSFRRTTAGAITAIRFLFRASGNITSGKFALYGLQNAL